MGDNLEKEQYAVPDEKTLAKVGEFEIFDEQKNKTPFKDLYKSAEGKHLIVFIRHFFCGHCEAYVRALSTDLSPEKLATVSTDLTIIGCGQTSNIADYKQRTDCAFPIYTDPDKRLYAALGMVSKLDFGEKKPEYISSGLVGGTLSSMWNMVKSGTKGFSGGDFSQNGGEWLFDRGVLQWCHRMQNTRDHAEIGELKRVLGLEDC